MQEILLNIVYCYGFVQDENLTLLLTRRRKLVSYYLSKGFVVLDWDYRSLKNVPLIGKKTYMMLICLIVMIWWAGVPQFLMLKINQRIFISVELFWMNPLLHNTMIRIIPFKCCFGNINIVMLTTLITQILSKNGNITWTRKLMKIIYIRVFTYLLKRDNYIESWM